MAINSIGFSGSLFGQAVQSLNNQLTNLSTQLATGGFQRSNTFHCHTIPTTLTAQLLT